MKINLCTDGTSSQEQQKIVYWLASEMAKDYKINPKEGVMFFVHEGSKDLCNWIKQKYNVNVRRFLFKDDIRTYGAGFDFEEGPDLTVLLLNVPSGKLTLGR